MRETRSRSLVVPPSPSALHEASPIATTFPVASANGGGTGFLLNGDRKADGEDDALFVHGFRGEELSLVPPLC